MEALVFILIVVFIALSGKNKKQPRQGQPTATDAGKPARRVPASGNLTVDQLREAARARLETFVGQEAAPVAQMSPEARREARRQARAAQPAPVEAAVKPDPQAVRMPLGASLLDDEGCVGGSMDHDHDEGESRREHAQHVEAAKRREASEMLERAEAERRQTVNTRRLRQAVVMAEVLDRPVALRPRGCGRRAS